jgi:hypothetical protein
MTSLGSVQQCTSGKTFEVCSGLMTKCFGGFVTIEKLISFAAVI